MNLLFIFIYKNICFTDSVITKELININIKNFNRQLTNLIDHLLTKKMDTIYCPYEIGYLTNFHESIGKNTPTHTARTDIHPYEEWPCIRSNLPYPFFV
jgi:hypothetical protein